MLRSIKAPAVPSRSVRLSAIINVTSVSSSKTAARNDTGLRDDCVRRFTAVPMYFLRSAGQRSPGWFHRRPLFSAVGRALPSRLGTRTYRACARARAPSYAAAKNTHDPDGRRRLCDPTRSSSSSTGSPAILPGEGHGTRFCLTVSSVRRRC